MKLMSFLIKVSHDDIANECNTLRGWIKGKSRDTYLMYP